MSTTPLPILSMPTGTGTGGAGTTGFGNAMNPNPTSGGVSMFPGGTPSQAGPPQMGTVTGQNGQQIQSPNTFDQTGRQQNRSLGELQQYYGEGIGSMLYQYLQGGAGGTDPNLPMGGYNAALTQQSVDAQIGAMQQQIGQGANDLQSRLGAMGVSGGSSGMQYALGNYMDQAMKQENAITANEYYDMWNQSMNREMQMFEGAQNRELSMLQDVSKVNATGTANQSSWMDTLGSIFQGAAGIGGLFGG